MYYAYLSEEKKGAIMWKWLVNNLSTIIIAAVLLGALLAIAIKLIKDKKRGKSSCGCNCKGCALCGKCHGGCASNASHNPVVTKKNQTSSDSSSSAAQNAADPDNKA